IWAGAGAWINRAVLGHRLLVYIGLISYPLYLWHWPLLSFLRITEGAEPPRGLRAAAVAMSFVLAAATYEALGRPIRRTVGWPTRAGGTGFLSVRGGAPRRRARRARLPPSPPPPRPPPRFPAQGPATGAPPFWPPRPPPPPAPPATTRSPTADSRPTVNIARST